METPESMNQERGYTSAKIEEVTISTTHNSFKNLGQDET